MRLMSDGPQKTRFDTNRLGRPTEPNDPPAEVDTEGPTRPLHPEQFAAPDPPDAPPGRPTAPHSGPEGPYATMPSAPTQGAYMPPPVYAPPPPYVQPPGTAPVQQALYAPATAPQRPPASISAQLGLKQNFSAMACYMPFLGLVASIVLSVSEPRENRFLRFHARQSLFAHIAFWAVSVAFSIARASTPSVVSLLLLLPQLGFFFAAIAGFVYLMVKTYRWQTVKIPIIGDQVE
jgi:uncharacterized membrane protein